MSRRVTAPRHTRRSTPHTSHRRDTRETSATTTMTMEISSNDDQMTTEIPTLAQLLTSIDVSNVRTESGMDELRNTIRALVSRAETDGVNSLDYLKLAILIGFKRRNHDKSQAPGVGAGERDCLRVMLHEIDKIDDSIVKRVLPLVPVYGSWRDLQVLAEMAFPVEGEPNGLSREITQLFATQLQRDDTLTKSSSNDCPSNACKYAPHEFRHNGSRNKKAEKKSQARKIQARLGDIIATKIFPSSATHVRPQYRKLLSSLNSRLAEKGFLIEPLMCRNEKSKIRFNRAPKGSLNKYRKAIMKDPVAARKWKTAMSKSDSAVPDINDLEKVVKQISEDPEMVALMLGKCVNKLRSTRSELVEQASALLAKLIEGDEAETFKQTIQELQLGSVAIYPVVDSNGASSSRLIALLLAAFIVSRSQKLPHFVLDGVLVSIVEGPIVVTVPVADPAVPVDESAAPTRTPESQEEILIATNFLQRISNLSENLSPLRSRGDLERISNNLTSLLASVPNDPDSIRHVDCLFLTLSSLDEINGDMEQYQTTLQSFQHRSANETNLRTLCIHRLIASFDAEGSIPLVMRPTREIVDRQHVTLDLLLVMDLTGSMGSWMTEAKQHLVDIVNSLKEDTGIGGIRVGFVGYRDFNDAGRTVHHSFVPISQSEQVLAVIRSQEPSGGGDTPEDVLSGFTIARTNFNWNGDLRLMLFIADAPAHGLCDGGDYYPTGRCPDQSPPHLNLEETTRSLASESQVDLLFCRLNDQTSQMEAMFQDVYNSGGFGVLPMTSGPDAFRAAILSTISSSILKVLAPDNVGGLQTFAGATASSLFSTVNSSLRESLSSVAKTFKGDDMETVEKTDEAKADDDVVGEDGIDLGIGAEDEEEEEERGEEEEVERAPKRTRPVTTSSRTDFERIMSELNSEDLAPVRLALGMDVEASLLDKSAEILFRAGVTVQDLKEQGYPEGIIDALTNSGLKKLTEI